MTVVTANELKTRGVSVLESAMEQAQDVVISVRGKERFVVLGVDTYHRLREAELDAALSEVKADLAAGRVHRDSVSQHIRRVKREL
jgi:prevent-host-death family protein